MTLFKRESYIGNTSVESLEAIELELLHIMAFLTLAVFPIWVLTWVMRTRIRIEIDAIKIRNNLRRNLPYEIQDNFEDKSTIAVCSREKAHKAFSELENELFNVTKTYSQGKENSLNIPVAHDI